MHERWRMMKLDKYKVIDNILFFCLIGFVLMALLAFPIAYLPHFEKGVYEKQEPLTWESLEELRKGLEESGIKSWKHAFTGYPTEGMNTELTSYEQFEEKKFEQFFCLEVDVEDLEATGLYKLVYEFELISGGGGVGIRRTSYRGTVRADEYTNSYVKTVLNRNKGIYGQYYALKLDDGSRILVLLNDTMLDIPKKGVVQLPYASSSYLSLDAEGANVRNLIEKYNLKYDSYYNDVDVLNASTMWLSSNDDIEAAVGLRRSLGLILFCIGVAGTLILLLGSAIFLRRVK